MNKWVSSISSMLLSVAVGCSTSASSTKNGHSPAVVTTTAPSGSRALAVTVPSGPDEPVKVTIAIPTTTTVIVAQPPRIIPSDLLFPFDSARLSDEAGPLLATMLSAGKVFGIQIDGHTDSDGDEGYNVELSERRAEAVRDWFVRQGIAIGSITVKGWGELKPTAPNDTPENKSKNRRVEITITVSG